MNYLFEPLTNQRGDSGMKKGYNSVIKTGSEFKRWAVCQSRKKNEVTVTHKVPDFDTNIFYFIRIYYLLSTSW